MQSSYSYTYSLVSYSLVSFNIYFIVHLYIVHFKRADKIVGASPGPLLLVPKQIRAQKFRLYVPLSLASFSLGSGLLL